MSTQDVGSWVWAGTRVSVQVCPAVLEALTVRSRGGDSWGQPGPARTAEPSLAGGRGSADLPAHRVLTLFSPPSAVSSQKWLQACPQQPAPSVPGCAAQLPARPPACRLCPEHRPWQQRGLRPSSARKRPGPQGQPSPQPQLGHPCALCPGCGPAGPQRVQRRPAPAPQRPAWRGRGRREQRRRRRRGQAERHHQ